jgi:hypothetical protein
MQPITCGYLRARKIWVDEALSCTARCRRVALRSHYGGRGHVHDLGKEILSCHFRMISEGTSIKCATLERSMFLGSDGESSITAPVVVCDSSHGRPNRRYGQTSNVCSGSFASVWPYANDFRSTPMNRHRYHPPASPKGAKLGHDPHQSSRRNQAQHGLRIPHIAKCGCQRGKCPTMFRVGHCRAGIGHKEHLVVHHHRIPCRRFAADLR